MAQKSRKMLRLYNGLKKAAIICGPGSLNWHQKKPQDVAALRYAAMNSSSAGRRTFGALDRKSRSVSR